MKIAFVLDDTIDSTDGVQQYVKLLGSWLKKTGHEVHYICGQSNKTGSKVHSLTKNVRVSFNKNRLSIPLPINTKQTKQLLNKQHYDILHIQMPYSPFLAGKIISIAPQKTGLIATFHIVPHGRLEYLSTRLLAKFQKTSSRKLQSVISVSKVAQKFLQNSYFLDSKIIPNSVDVSRWNKYKNTNKEIDICFIGRLVQRKGCAYLLRACKILFEEYQQDFRVVIAGDGVQRRALVDYVNKNNLQNNIKFLGYISEDKKQQLLAKSKLTVLPATGGESFGIVLLEAMAAGSLVLGGDNPGYSEVLEQIPDSIIQSKNSQQIAQKIHLMLNDANQYQKIFNQQQKILKQYNIDVVGSAILDMYKKILS